MKRDTAGRVVNTGCPCVSRHSPASYGLQRHHVVPLSWGGPDTEDNIVAVCVTTHHNIHSLLNAYVRAGGLPPWEIRQHYSEFARDLAARAWERRPSEKPPYTASL